MIIEAALVFGMPSGVNSVGAAIVSGSSFDFARARCDRVWLDFDRFVFGASDSFSSSELFCVTAFAFRTGPLTPLGRTISESTTSCAHAPTVELRISAQRNQIRLRQIMDGKLRTKRPSAQVPPLHMPCHLSVRQACKVLCLTALDEFDLVAFGRVNEGNSTAVRHRRMWTVGQPMAFCLGVFSKLVQIVDFKCEMRE